MFDKKSDYAQNKRDKDAIVYIGVTGPALLTRADFANEDEFMRWKHWSDSDYHATERSGRCYYDNGLPLADEYLDFIVSAPSVEDELFQKLAEAEAHAERARTCALLMVQIRSCLTQKQYRRLWLLCVEEMSVDAIAAAEGVTHQNISKSIIKARKKLQKNFGFSGKTGCEPACKNVKGEGHAFPFFSEP